VNILIVSIDHRFQLVRGALAMPLDGLRDRLEALLQKKIEERNVAFIGEEAAPCPNRPTIAQKLAGTHDPPIPWQNIDMTEAERKSAGIHDALNNRRFDLEWRGPEAVPILHRIPEDDIREEFMASKAIECAGRAESIVVLCGDMHTRALKQKFERRGHSADIDESLIAHKDWTD
jgi:pheromone shutdown protein TraB